MLSTTWQYTVRTLVHLAVARNNGKGPVLCGQIAVAESIPYPFLGKIMRLLKNAGIVDSNRGQKGGYFLKRDPSKITLLTIAHLTDHIDFSEQCLLGYKFCGSHTNCNVHSEWEGIKAALYEFLKSVTIERLAQDINHEILDTNEMLQLKQPILKPPYKQSEVF